VDGAARRRPVRSGLPRRVAAERDVYLPSDRILGALEAFGTCSRCHWSVPLPAMRRARCPRCSAPNS